MNSDDWPLVTLNEAGINLYDCVHDTPKAVESGLPWISIPEMKTGVLNFKTARKISPEDFTKWTKGVLPQKHDVVVSRRTNPGVFAPVLDNTKFALGQNLVVLRADGTRVLPEFLRILIASHHWDGQVFSFINTGAVFESLTCYDIQQKMRLPIPDKIIQRKIINILSPLEDLLFELRPMNEKVETVISTLFRSWFIDFDPVKAKAEGKLPHGMDEETAALFPDTFEDSEHGLLPKGWTWGTLLDISKIWTGGTPKTSESSYWGGDIPWVSGADLSSSELFAFDSKRKITSLGVDKSSTKVLPVGTVMITARGTVGATKITAVPMAMSQTSFGFKAKKGISDTLVYQASQETIRQLRSYAYGAVFDTFTQSTIDITKIAIAPLEILQAFGKIVDPLFETMKNSAKAEINLATIRDALLPRLMSGEFGV